MRHQKPAIYNEDRLYERPIPFVGDVESEAVDEFDSFDSEANENDCNESFGTRENTVSIETTDELTIDQSIESNGSQEDMVSIGTTNEAVIDDNIESSATQEPTVSIVSTDGPAIDPLDSSIKVEEAYIEMVESDRDELYAFLHLDIDETMNNDDSDVESERNGSFALNTVSNVVASGVQAIHEDEVNPVLCSSSTTDTNAAEKSAEPNLLEVDVSLPCSNVGISNNNNDIGGASGGLNGGLNDGLNGNDIGGGHGGATSGENGNEASQNDSIDEIEFGAVDVLKGFPLPQGIITTNGLTKRENDLLSGNLPYSVKV